MSSRTQDELYRSFVEASGKQASNLEVMAKSLTEVMTQANRAQPVQAQASTVVPVAASMSSILAPSLNEIISSLANTVSPANNVQSSQSAGAAQSQSSSGASAGTGNGIGGTIESIASTVLKGGLGIVPIVSELFGLFGGGGPSPPQPLVKYAMPASVDFETAETQSGLSNTDYDQMGMPRAYAAGRTTGNGDSSASSNNSTGQSNSGSSRQQITVNVQAMDARSFLDRSSDIAAAVRDAMLNLSSINDVVNDL